MASTNLRTTKEKIAAESIFISQTIPSRGHV
jgi:hypothetical protein